MITKIDLINLIQSELSSGVMPKDFRTKYPIAVVSRILNGILEEICNKNPIAREETAIEFTLELKGDSKVGYYSTLSKPPITGVNSFQYIKSGGERVRLRSKGMGDALKVLQGGGVDCAILRGNVIQYSYKPSEPIIAAYVPNVSSMENGDYLVLGGSEKYILQACVEYMRRNDVRPKDILNDNHIDAEK